MTALPDQLPAWFLKTRDGQKAERERQSQWQAARQAAVAEIRRLEAQEAAELPPLREKADRALAAFRKTEAEYDRALAAYREARHAADSRASTLDAHKCDARRILREHVPAALAELLEWLKSEQAIVCKMSPDVIHRSRWRLGFPVVESFSNAESIQARARALIKASSEARDIAEEALDEQDVAARCKAIREKIPAIQQVKDPDAS